MARPIAVRLVAIARTCVCCIVCSAIFRFARTQCRAQQVWCDRRLHLDIDSHVLSFSGIFGENGEMRQFWQPGYLARGAVERGMSKDGRRKKTVERGLSKEGCRKRIWRKRAVEREVGGGGGERGLSKEERVPERGSV